MSTTERRAEICELLALGLIRLRARQSSKYPGYREIVRYTSRPGRAVMRNVHDGELHDRPDPRPPGRAEDDGAARSQGRMAHAVRRRAARLQPPLPREPARLPHSGAGLWRAEAGDAEAPRGAGRAVRRSQHHPPPHPRRRHADRRHPAAARVAGCRAHGHGADRRLRVAGPAVPVALGDRPRHHRHPLERPRLLRAEEPEAA